MDGEWRCTFRATDDGAARNGDTSALMTCEVFFQTCKITYGLMRDAIKRHVEGSWTNC